eukprot:1786847-Rhodomonas_salina.2
MSRNRTKPASHLPLKQSGCQKVQAEEAESFKIDLQLRCDCTDRVAKAWVVSRFQSPHLTPARLRPFAISCRPMF